MTRPENTRSLWKTVAPLVLALCMFAPLAWAQSAEDEPDDHTIRMNYSLYFENYRNQDFRAALPYLRWIIENAPLFAGPDRRDGRNYERAWKTYEQLALGEEDAETRRAYLDSALVMMDEAMAKLEEENIEYDEFKWILDRGRFVHSYPDDLADRQEEVVDAYTQALEMDAERLDPYFIQYLVTHFRDEDRRQDAIDLLDRAEGYYADNPEMIAWINRQRNVLFTDPADRIEWLEGQLAADPEDLDIMGQLADLYAQTDQIEKQRAMARQMVELRPTARGYMQLGQLAWHDANYDEALSHYERAIQLAEETAMLRDLHYNSAIIHQERGRIQLARASARRALEFDPSFGPAYMLIGDVYVQAVQNQGAMDRRDKAVFWLVLDYYERARNADPAVAGRANANIRTYRQYMPTREDLFFEGWQPGSRFNINYGAYGWINEATTVRTP